MCVVFGCSGDCATRVDGTVRRATRASRARIVDAYIRADACFRVFVEACRTVREEESAFGEGARGAE